MFKIGDKPTTFPGVVLSVALTLAVWLGTFVAAWHVGLAITGSEIGAAAAVVFVPLCKDHSVKIWTK